ncbi:MAG: dihydroorotase [Clostridia bacterium]|nr:dihydroorotase [Clostridia bacterium]
MIFRNATVWKQNQMMKQDVAFENGMLHFSDSDTASVSSDSTVISDCLILPGFCDVHVHFREPGFCYKETIASGTASAVRGGYTAVCTMPNLNPVPDSKQHLNVQLQAIRKDASIAVLPYGALTVGEAGEVEADLEGMAADAVAFSDDGKGVQSEDMMRALMLRAKKLGKMVVAHCEDNSLLHGGYIHDGAYAKAHGHRGICSESEWRPIARDLKLAEETGCAYHVCHISAKESVELIRQAKARGVNVTCETAPHYLVMSDADLQEHGRFKMNPPLRDESDRAALMEGILDGTIDMIATDHAPHSAEEKSRGLEKSAFGVVGLETAFPVLYTELVKTGILSLEKLVELMSVNPRRRFGITSDAGYTVWDVSREYPIDPAAFASMGRATPFEGRRVCGENLFTVYNGNIVYRKNAEN